MIEYEVQVLNHVELVQLTAGGEPQEVKSDILNMRLKSIPPEIAAALKGIHGGAYMMLNLTGPIALNWTEAGKTIRVTIEAIK